MPSVSKSLRRDSSHPPRLFLNIRMSRIIVGNFNLQGLYIKHSFGRSFSALGPTIEFITYWKLYFAMCLNAWHVNISWTGHTICSKLRFPCIALWKDLFFRSFKFFAFLPGHLQLAASGRCYIWKQQQQQQQQHNHHQQPSIFWEMSWNLLIWEYLHLEFWK